MQDVQGETSAAGTYLALFRRWWALIAAMALVAGLASFLVENRKPRVYLATTDVLVEIVSGGDNASPWDAVEPSLLANEARYANSALFGRELAKRIDGPLPRTEARLGTNAAVIRFSAWDKDPKRAALVADTFAATFADVRAQLLSDKAIAADTATERLVALLTDQLAALPQTDDPGVVAQRQAIENRLLQLRVNQGTQLTTDVTGGVTVLDPATPPVKPVAPQPLRSAGLGVGVGLAMAIGLAFAFQSLDRRIRTENDLLEVIGSLPILARVPTGETTDLQGIASFDSGQPFGESFRTLRTSLRFLQLDRQLDVVQVTSAAEGEGKSTIAANLAVAIAASGHPVVLIDVDLRRPTIHQRFQLVNDAGLSTVMLGESNLTEACRPVVSVPLLRVLPTGPLPANPADFLWPLAGGERLTLPAIIHLLRGAGWKIVLDTTPVLPVADALTVAGMVDATLVVAQLGSTDRRSLAQALTSLQQTGATVVGAVVNRSTSGAYGYRYGYRQHAAAPKLPAASSDVGTLPPPPPAQLPQTVEVIDVRMADTQEPAEAAEPTAGQATTPGDNAALAERLRGILGVSERPGNSVPPAERNGSH